MLNIQIASLTELNRNSRLLHTALDEHGLVLLTHYSRTALAVVNVQRFEQLLAIAEQAAALRDQPDLRQLSALFNQFDRAPLLADRATLAEERAEVIRLVEREQTP